MFELVLGIIASSGVLGIIVGVVKWLISSISKHTDRMVNHVDDMNDSFNLQTERLLGSLQQVRHEIGSVREALYEHTVEHIEEWHKLDKRLDQSDIAQSKLLDQIDLLDARVDEHIFNNNNNNGHSQVTLNVNSKVDDSNE